MHTKLLRFLTNSMYTCRKISPPSHETSLQSSGRTTSEMQNKLPKKYKIYPKRREWLYNRIEEERKEISAFVAARRGCSCAGRYHVNAVTSLSCRYPKSEMKCIRPSVGKKSKLFPPQPTHCLRTVGRWAFKPTRQHRRSR